MKIYIHPPTVSNYSTYSYLRVPSITKLYLTALFDSDPNFSLEFQMKSYMQYADKLASNQWRQYVRVRGAMVPGHALHIDKMTSQNSKKCKTSHGIEMFQFDHIKALSTMPPVYKTATASYLRMTLFQALHTFFSELLAR